MILMNVAQDDIMGVPGFEHRTFACSDCQDIERRLVFTKQSGEDDTEPMPSQAAPPIAPASTVQDEYVAPSVITEHNRECATELVPVHAAPLVAAPSTTQDEYVARSGVLSRVVEKIRGH